MKRIRPVTAAEENFRTEPLGHGLPSNMTTSRKDPVQPIPVGSFVALVFRVAGYRPRLEG